MRVLDRKLLRDLRRLSTQALAISLVMACGAAVIILAAGASRSLEKTSEAFYDRYRFATVFASATRAPEHLLTSIRALPEVSSVETRIMEAVLLDIDGMQEPATALALSIPEHRQATVNRLYLRMGRLPEPVRVGEFAIAEAFAEAHGFVPGDRFYATMNGKRRQLTITGIVLSPEFVYAIGPGDIVPDQRRFGVLSC